MPNQCRIVPIEKLMNILTLNYFFYTQVKIHNDGFIL